MDEKKCIKCKKEKPLTEFYCYQGVFRTNCKSCAIRGNTQYTKKRRAMLKAMGISVYTEARIEYMRAYRNDNKEKYEDYTKAFLNRNPEYFKEYYRNRRDGSNKFPSTHSIKR